MAEHEVERNGTSVVAHVRSKLEQTIGNERIELWIGSDTTWSFQNGELDLGFVSEFACQLCQRMMAAEINQALVDVLGQEDGLVRFSVRPDASSSRNAVRSQAAPCHPPTVGPDKSRGATSPTPDILASILQGDSNQMAVAATKIATTEAGRLTPIVLHGPAGCGKSLFLSGVTQRLRNNRSLRRVLAMTSEQFTNDFTESLRGGGLPMFRRKYREVDAMVLDDIQFFVGKRATISELRYTIDVLVQAGKQVVLSMDRPMTELTGLGDELLGRLRSGLTVPLLPLDSQIRVGILRRLTANAGLKLQPDVLEQLAEHLTGDGRLVHGVCNRLIAIASVQSGPLTWDRCWSAVYDLVQSNQPIIRLADIERAVSGMFGLEHDSLQSESKMRSVSQPRMLAMYLARKYTPAAYKEIGEYFGRRRHSTVISAEKTVAEWLRDNTRLEGIHNLPIREAIRQVEAQLKVG